MRRITWLLTLVLAGGVLAVAGCGGGSSGSSATSTPTSSGSSSSASETGNDLTVTADPNGAVSWDKTSLSAKSGKVTLKLVNQSQTPHAIALQGQGVDEATKVVSGGTASLSVKLKPGKYEYFCPVPGHRQSMHGTLTVS